MCIKGLAVDPFVKFILHQPHLLNTDIVDTAEKKNKICTNVNAEFLYQNQEVNLCFFDTMFKHKKQFVCHPFI